MLLKSLLLASLVFCCPSCPAVAIDYAVAVDSAVADVIAAFGLPWVANVIMVSAVGGVPPADVLLTAGNVPLLTAGNVPGVPAGAKVSNVASATVLLVLNF